MHFLALWGPDLVVTGKRWTWSATSAFCPKHAWVAPQEDCPSEWETSRGSLQRGDRMVRSRTCCQSTSPAVRLLLFWEGSRSGMVFQCFHFSFHRKMENYFKTWNWMCKSLWSALQNRVWKPWVSGVDGSVHQYSQCHEMSEGAGRLYQVWGSSEKGIIMGLSKKRKRDIWDSLGLHVFVNMSKY